LIKLQSGLFNKSSVLPGPAASSSHQQLSGEVAKLAGGSREEEPPFCARPGLVSATKPPAWPHSWSRTQTE